MRFSRDRDRLQFLFSRVVLRRHLARALGCLPVEIQFARSAHGKPRVDVPESGEFGFSLSHTAGAIAIAIGRGAVGVDIECLSERAFPDEIVTRVFCERERDHLRALSPELRSCEAFTWWTRKEALLKADGRGLGAGPALTTLDVSAREATADADWSCNTFGKSWRGQTRVIASSFATSIVREAIGKHAHAAITWVIHHEEGSEKARSDAEGQSVRSQREGAQLHQGVFLQRLQAS